MELSIFSSEIVLLILAYTLTYLLIYRKECTVGNIVFMGIGAYTFIMIPNLPAISWLLTILPLGSLIYDWLSSPNKKNKKY